MTEPTATCTEIRGSNGGTRPGLDHAGSDSWPKWRGGPVMYYLARDADGRALIGDDDGYVPHSAAEPSLSGIDDVLGHRPADLSDLDKATARRIPAAHIEFARPLPTTGKVFGIGQNYADHAADLDEDSPDEPAIFFNRGGIQTAKGSDISMGRSP